MTWHGIRDHDDLVGRFRLCLSRGRLASTFLFVGRGGIGKRTFARKLAQSLFCERVAEAELDPCETCPACVQAVAGTHPDLELIAKPQDRNVIPVELFIGSGERRGREGLCYNIARKPIAGARKVAVIDDADALGVEGANCLLKMLEEPPPRSVLILIGTSVEKQLPTIRSRCQIIRFQPLSYETVAELLLEQGLAADAAEAGRLARYSDGSLQRAAELTEAPLWEFRTRLLSGLAHSPLRSVQLARDVTAFVDEAGKEAPLRRSRARQLVGFAIEYYRQLARGLCGAPLGNDEQLRTLIEQASRSWPGDAESAGLCVERCLDALSQIDRNANLPNVLEYWLDELGEIGKGGMSKAS